MKRTIQTAEALGVPYEQWKVLNEIDAVITVPALCCSVLPVPTLRCPVLLGSAELSQGNCAEALGDLSASLFFSFSGIGSLLPHPSFLPFF